MPDAGRYAFLLLLGRIYLLDGSYDKALHNYKEAQRLVPSAADAYYAIGDAYYDLVLYESVLDRTYRLDSAEPLITIKSRDKAQVLLSAMLQQYEIGHRNKTLQDLYPTVPHALTFRPLVQWRDKQARIFVNDKAQQILLHRNEVLKLAPWAVASSAQEKAGGVPPIDEKLHRATKDPTERAIPNLQPTPAVERPLPAIMREIEPNLKTMIKVISSHTPLQKKAAEHRKTNRAGLEELRTIAAQSPA